MATMHINPPSPDTSHFATEERIVRLQINQLSTDMAYMVGKVDRLYDGYRDLADKLVVVDSDLRRLNEHLQEGAESHGIMIREVATVSKRLSWQTTMVIVVTTLLGVFGQLLIRLLFR